MIKLSEKEIKILLSKVATMLSAYPKAPPAEEVPADYGPLTVFGKSWYLGEIFLKSGMAWKDFASMFDELLEEAAKIKQEGKKIPTMFEFIDSLNTENTLLE